MSKIVVDDSKYQRAIEGKARAEEVLGFLCGRLNEKKVSSSKTFLVESGYHKEELFFVDKDSVDNTESALIWKAIGVGCMAISTLVIIIGVVLNYTFILHSGLIGCVFGFAIKLFLGSGWASLDIMVSSERKRVAHMWWQYSDEIEVFSPKMARFVKKTLSESKWKDDEFKIIVGVNEG